MSNPPVDFFNRKGKLPRWLRILKTRIKKREPSAGKKKIGGLLIGIATVSIALVMVTWLFVVIIAPNFPASRSSLTKSERAAHLTALALRNFLPGHDVRIERLFAYNLKLYVDRKSFEDIPYPDRNVVTERMGRLWCDNIEHPWLGRVGVFDIRSGDRLATHVCAFGKFKEFF
jgi:hypothetical protein